MARAGIFVAQLIQALYPALVFLQHRHAPRAPLPASRVTSCGVMFDTTSDGVTHPSSLILAHAPSQIPPTVFKLTITTGLCRLSLPPRRDWKMALPDIISAILAWALGPLPRSVPLVLLLASSQRTTASHPTSHVRHTENNPYNATSTGKVFSGLQSFANVQAPTLVSPPGCTYR